MRPPAGADGSARAPPPRTMDPAIVAFGFGIGLLVGMTGMGGASLMTPLLILIFGVQPVTAIGTDIFYAAVTKTFGGVPTPARRRRSTRASSSGWRCGSVPAAIAGVGVIAYLQDTSARTSSTSIVFGILGATPARRRSRRRCGRSSSPT